MKCTIACYSPWRRIIPIAYIVSTGGFLLLITAGVLLPSLRRVSLSSGSSMTRPGVQRLPGAFLRRLRESSSAKRGAQKTTVRHRVRTGNVKLTPLPAQVPGEARRPAHLVVLETSNNKPETCGDERLGERTNQTNDLTSPDREAPPKV